MRPIVCLTDPDTKEKWFFQWSGVTDTVILPGMTFAELLLEIEDSYLYEAGAHWLRKMYGPNGMVPFLLPKTFR